MNPENGLQEEKDKNPTLQKSLIGPVLIPDMQPQNKEHLRDYLYVLHRRKWIALTFFTLVVVTVLLAVLFAKPVYRAKATIRIEQETPSVLTFKDIYEARKDDLEYFETQYQILKSRNISERVVRALRLDQVPEFAVTGGKAPHRGRVELSGNAGYIAPELVDKVRSRITIQPVRNSSIIAVNFDDPDPVLAARAANEITKQYIKYSIESKLDVSRLARDWLEGQLDDIKARLERSEEALNTYAARNGIILTGTGKDGSKAGGSDIITNRLEQVSALLIQATSERIDKGALYYQLKKGGAWSIPVVMNNPLIQSLLRNYTGLKAQYARLSTDYTPDYPRMIQIQKQMDQFKKRINGEVKKAGTSIQMDYEAALEKEKILTATYEEAKNEALDLKDKMVQYNILKREAETNQELYNGLLQRMKEIGVTATLTASNIQVLDGAKAPEKPYAPKKARDLLAAVLVGVLGGIGLAFFVDYIDNTVKSAEDVERSVALPCLGLVPEFDDAGGAATPGGERRLPELGEEQVALVEAYNSINTYIQFSSGGRFPKLMLITSPQKGEGKTTTSANLAVTMARTYKGKGIIIDSDMRNPQLHKIFDVENSNGLSGYLTGNAFIEEGFIQKTAMENLDIITAGLRTPNASDLLNSPRLAELLRRIEPEYAFIIFDSPPVIGFSDSLILSASMDGVIMVARTGRTTREALHQTRKSLESINSRIFGVVLNAMKQTDLKYSSYYYSDYYNGDENSAGGKKKNKKKIGLEI